MPDAPPPRSPPRRPERTDGRGVPLSKGVQWASVGTTIAMEMAGAPLIGYGIDYLAGTFPLFLLLFTAVGFWLGVSQLLAAVEKGPRTATARAAGGARAAAVRRFRLADSRTLQIVFVHWLHATTVTLAVATPAAVFDRWHWGRVSVEDVVLAGLLCGLPGLIGLAIGYGFKARHAVFLAIAAAFFLRLLVFGLHAARQLPRDGAANRAYAFVMLAGLLAGLTAEGAMIARPPPRPD